MYTNSFNHEKHEAHEERQDHEENARVIRDESAEIADDHPTETSTRKTA
jgi:hypothetical protein